MPRVTADVAHALQDAAARFHAKLSQAEQAKRDSQAAGRSRVKREKEEHAARGPVPQPCRDFRLPQAQVAALLMVWELTQVSHHHCCNSTTPSLLEICQ